MKYILTISSFIAISMIGCTICKFGKGELNDSRKIFSDKKEYIYNLAFSGLVLSKNNCIKCDFNKYSIDIKLLTLCKKPTFSQEQMPPYYIFKNDSILSISISKELYEKLKERDHLTKENQSYNIKLYDMEVPLINMNPNTCLP